MVQTMDMYLTEHAALYTISVCKKPQKSLRKPVVKSESWKLLL